MAADIATARGQPESVALLATSLRDARRLQVTEAGEIADIVRQWGGDPDALPFV